MKNRVLMVDVDEVRFDDQGNVDQKSVRFKQSFQEIDSLPPFERDLVNRALMAGSGPSFVTVAVTWFKGLGQLIGAGVVRLFARN